jgi:hypothetical protein
MGGEVEAFCSLLAHHAAPSLAPENERTGESEVIFFIFLSIIYVTATCEFVCVRLCMRMCVCVFVTV